MAKQGGKMLALICVKSVSRMNCEVQTIDASCFHANVQYLKNQKKSTSHPTPCQEMPIWTCKAPRPTRCVTPGWPMSPASSSHGTARSVSLAARREASFLEERPTAWRIEGVVWFRGSHLATEGPAIKKAITLLPKCEHEMVRRAVLEGHVKLANGAILNPFKGVSGCLSSCRGDMDSYLDVRPSEKAVSYLAYIPLVSKSTPLRGTQKVGS